MSVPPGVLPVDKPVGPTSHDIVAVARRAIGTRRIGHTGTLDPFASGLLLLCLGPATRLAEYLTGLPKSYAATLVLGTATDTDDREGVAIETSDRWEGLTRPQVEAALASQLGQRLQLPPRYSAKKVGGRRMYDAAREGIELERTPAQVTISRIEVTRFEPPEVDFEVDCSSGTYIRAIARDLGERLAVGAHLSALRRTRIGHFGIDEAIAVDAMTDAGAVHDALIRPAEALSHLPSYVLDEQQLRDVSHGGSVHTEASVADGDLIRLVSGLGDLAAVAEARGTRLQPRKVFL